MRKIRIIILVLCIITCLFGQSFWYLEKTVYCDLGDKNVTIYLKKMEWLTRCKTYLDTIHQLASKKYSEILLIRSYINQGDDVYYWKKILEEKNSEFLQLAIYKNQIKTAIDRFESALFEKYCAILKKPMQVYYSDLEAQYYILSNKEASHKKSDNSLVLAHLEQQMWNVNHILTAQKLDDIMSVISSYIYLKRQIEWR